ncbi:adenosine deaminase [Thalassovita sp.]|uniref:adenosine deaminase n=1 Tax=Thalassovita sp. TaxID=1979401 RepID=UPI0029DE69D5|nr:adenosine deaminase [Thalassovita sp.]
MSWKAYPKLELHLHLEGAAPAAFIRGLAQEKSINLDGVFNERGTYSYRSFPEFLQVYEAATQVLRTPKDYQRLTRAVLEQAAENGVIYLETFLSPDFCGGRDLGGWREYLHAIQETASEAEAELGVTLRGIITCIRHFGPDKARQTAICAAETAGDWIVGFGMGGDETKGKQGDFAWAFECAREAGLRLTTHAGEWQGPQSIRDALDLGVERIGHGVRAIEDPRLMEILAERQIVLEVCPGSNVALGLYRNFGAHPIARLREAGVKVTVSTDDPPFFHTSMTREFEGLERAFGWGADDFAELNQTALAAAFCDPQTRARLKERLENQ